MIIQALIISLFTALYILTPQANTLYWFFASFVLILYLVALVFIFASAIKLRYKRPDVLRPYKIPGGNIGMWIVAGTGFATSVSVLILSFLLPQYMLDVSILNYFPWFSLAMILICLLPHAILLFKNSSWKQPLLKNTS